MGLFDRFKKEKVIEVVKPTNKYYTGDDSFRYVNPENGLVIYLDIISEFNREQFPDLYLCEFKYSHTGRPRLDDNADPDDLKGFERVYIGFDKETMIGHEAYCKYVFEALLSPKHIRDLYEKEFEQIGIRKSGNYVGSIKVEDKKVFPVLYDIIGQCIEKLPETRTLHEKYDTGYAREYLEEVKKKEQEKRERMNQTEQAVVLPESSDDPISEGDEHKARKV